MIWALGGMPELVTTARCCHRATCGKYAAARLAVLLSLGQIRPDRQLLDPAALAVLR